MAYAAAIFDLDGTLLDTLDDLYDAVNYALGLYELPLRSKDKVRWAIGNGIRNLVRACLPKDADEGTFEEVFVAFKSYYREHSMDKTHPYPGIAAVLRHLRTRGIRCAVVSNKADAAVQTLIDHFFPGEFDAIVGEREAEGIRKKPAPDTVNEVMRVLGMKKRDVVYIGDSEVDIETAANVQCDCIAVTWGFRVREFLEDKGAPVLAETPEQLEHLITGEGLDGTAAA